MGIFLAEMSARPRSSPEAAVVGSFADLTQHDNNGHPGANLDEMVRNTTNARVR